MFRNYCFLGMGWGLVVNQSFSIKNINPCNYDGELVLVEKREKVVEGGEGEGEAEGGEEGGEVEQLRQMNHGNMRGSAILCKCNFFVNQNV